MKFDFCIGNPPYQEQVAKKETDNGQKRSRSIFLYFQMAADRITKKSIVLIYPATRWIHRSGKGMQQFGLDQMNDTKLKKLVVYPNAKEVFPSTEIADGISVVIKQMDKSSRGFDYVYRNNDLIYDIFMDNPGEDLIPINPNDVSIIANIRKFVVDNDISYLYESILPQKLFGIESDFVEKNPSKVSSLTPGSNIDFSTHVKLFTNDKAGKAGRATWFIAEKDSIPLHKELINEWQVVVSSASPGGQKRDNQLEIIDNHSAFGRSRVALKSFKTHKEAQNFYKYASSFIIRYALLLTDENLTSVGKLVPDILKYDDKAILDFSKDIDSQLCSLLNISEKEFSYIVKRVKALRN